MASTTTLSAFRAPLFEIGLPGSEAHLVRRSSTSFLSVSALSSSTGSHGISTSSFGFRSSLFGGETLKLDAAQIPQGSIRPVHSSAIQQKLSAVATASDYLTEERNFPESSEPGLSSRIGGIAAIVDDEWEGTSEEEEFSEVEEEVIPKDPLDIANLGVCKELEEALAKRGITRLFPIQAAVLAPAMAGKDVIARAKTGTGKTLAFGIPILDKIQKMNKELPGKWRGGPRCLVMAPTRELANQVNRELTESAPFLSAICVYGGVSIENQIRQLRRGVDIAVGTPGRINDLINRGALDLSDIKYMVLDEADQMLAVGFEEEVEKVMQLLPEGRQTQLFSATMPSWVARLSRKYLHTPVTIDLVGKDDDKLSEMIKVMCVRTPPQSKRSILVDLITVYGKGGKSIVFTQTKRDADDVSVSLGRTVGCQALHGDIAQAQREKTLQAFRDGRFSVLVATDVAARGLDIPDVDLVVHYEIPNDPETFVHRSGRTGRAGKSGTAVLMYTDSQARTLKIIERDLNSSFTRITPPNVDDVLAASSEQALVNLRQVHPDLREVFMETAHKVLAEDGVAALAAAIAHMSGYTQPPASRSLLTYEEGLTTVRMVRSARSMNGPISSAGSVMVALRSAMRAAADSVGKIKLISDRNVDGAVFDLPEDIAKELVGLPLDNGDSYEIIKELPRLQEEFGGRDRRTDNYGRFSSQGRGGGGGSRSRDYRGGAGGGAGYSRSGGGDRYGGDRESGSSSRGYGSDRRAPSGGGYGDRSSSSRFGGERSPSDWSSPPRGRAPPKSRGFSTSESWDEYGLADEGQSASDTGYERRFSSARPRASSRDSSAKFGGVCFICKQAGHRAADCPSAGQRYGS